MNTELPNNLPNAAYPDPAFRRGLWWITLPAAWLLYRLTMAPGVQWGDAGHAQLHTAMDGWLVEGQIARSHVLYFLCARGLQRLFELDPAVAANLMSTIGGAFTVANVGYLGAALCRTRAASVIGVLLMLFAHTHWRLSVSAEVVSLTTALLTAEWMCMVRLVESRRPRWLVWMLLFNGLGVANHNFAMLMWPVYGLLAVRFRTSWSQVGIPNALAAIGLFLLGASPLLLLCYADWRSHGSLTTTLQSLLLGSYSGKVTNLSRLPRLLLQTLAYTILNFPTPLLLLVPAGIIALRDRALPALKWLLLGAFAVYLLFGMRYDVPDQYTFLVPAFLLVAIFGAIGADHWLLRHPSPQWRASLLLAACLAPAAYLTLPPLLRRIPAADAFMPRREVPHRDRYQWFLRPWLHGDDGAERFARETLETLPPWAMLAVDSTLAAPINFVQFVEHVRRDVRLDCWAARQPWLAEVDWEIERAAAIKEGRLFTTSDDPKYQTPWLRAGTFAVEKSGGVFKVSD